MHSHQVSTLTNYIKFLKTHPHEINALFKDILIGVTKFFRDPEAFKALKQIVLTKLFKDKHEDDSIRVWVPGCSTGEEVYSIAIILRECLDETKCYYNAQIFGTDIDSSALDIARTGVYPRINRK